MSVGRFARAYVAGLVVLLVLDGVWLTVVAAPLYDAQLGSLLAPEPRAGAAVAFYALYLAGVVHLAVRPHLADGPTPVLRDGAVLGLVAYATWDLTNAAVLRDFPLLLVPIDLAWGTALTTAVAWAGWRAARVA